jgi:hypothetical protein
VTELEFLMSTTIMPLTYWIENQNLDRGKNLLSFIERAEARSRIQTQVTLQTTFTCLLNTIAVEEKNALEISRSL